MTGDGPITMFLAQARGNPQQWMQLVVFLLVLGGSFLSWLFKQVQAKAEQKRRMDAIERRRLEALRTGREIDEPATAPAPTGPPSADRQRELAARRQAQLQELRRRQLERARQGAGAPASAEPTRQTPLVIIPGSTGPIVVERAPPPARPGSLPGARPAPAEIRRPTVREQARAAPAEIQRPTVREQARQAPPEAPRHSASVGASRQAMPRMESERPKRAKGQRPRAQPAPSQAIDREQFTHISQAAPALQVSKVSHAGPVMVGVPSTPEDWRRAIIAREILGPPLAERAPGDPWQIRVL